MCTTVLKQTIGMKKPLLLFLSLLVAFAWTSQAIAQSNDWVELGSAKVEGRVDHDEIWVTALRGDFTAIKLRVEDEGIEFDHVIVHYGNGRNEELEVRDFIKAGGETRAIDLSGNDRVIRKVDFYYKSNPETKRKGKVILYGRR
jgi:hypothetical protein